MELSESKGPRHDVMPAYLDQEHLAQGMSTEFFVVIIHRYIYIYIHIYW